VIHLVVPADEPASLCGLGRSWGAPVSWRYPKDLAEVTCTACLLRYEARLIAVDAAVRRQEGRQ
jgi:hypothetical protein